VISEQAERILRAIEDLPEDQRRLLLRRLDDLYRSPKQESLRMTFEPDSLEGTPDYLIVFDGGSKGNPGPGYGSYHLTRASDGKSDLVRLDFGREMTNNEAEYETLIAALDGLRDRVVAADRDPGEFTVEIRGDSALVLRQVEGAWKTKDARMRMLRNRARDLLSQFKGHRLVLQGREESVRVLGH
jgi:ribonuclease HI